MKKIVLSLILPFFLLFFLGAETFAQNTKTLKLSDGKEITVSNNISENIGSISILETDFQAVFNSVGKVNSLSRNFLTKLKVTNRTTYNQVSKITTSFSLTQDGTEFYLRGLNSIKIGQIKSGNVKCRVLLFKVNSGGNIFYIPVLKSIKKI